MTIVMALINEKSMYAQVTPALGKFAQILVFFTLFVFELRANRA